MLIRPVYLLPLALLLTFLLLPTSVTAESGDTTNCTQPINISGSEGYVSVDPFLISDPSGKVHLFWAERTLGEPGDVPNVPDALMYAQWSHGEWSKPVDIFISPVENFNKKIAGIRGDIDEHGVIHLVWLGPDQTFYYSSAHVVEAGSARAWQTPLLLDAEQTGHQYSADIAYTALGTLHIIYGRSQDDVNRTVTYIQSVDGGLTWSDPNDIFTFLDFERGASNTRLYVDAPDKLYATWTEWDSSGNGQAVYFARSLDNGLHWDQPVMLAKRAEDEYERDWTNIAILGDDHLVAFWEGGFRAYPQAQYSLDGGVTWSEPIDTLYWLIADNGYAEFARDSLGRQHLFIARRIREGYPEICPRFAQCSGDGNAIWHSQWEVGPNWREPKPVDFTFSPVNFVSVAMTAGNKVTLAWFDYTDLEINVMQCDIEDTPAVALQTLPTPVPIPVTPTSVPAMATAEVPVQATPTVQLRSPTPASRVIQSSAQAVLLSSFIPACIFFLAIYLVSRNRRRN